MALVKAMVILVVLCMLMITCEGAGGSSIKLRRQQLSVYVHDNIYVSDLIIVKGPNFQPITPLDSSFGTVYFFNDLVTETADATSTPLGNITGAFIQSTLPYGAAYFTSALLTFANTSSPSDSNLRGLHGSLALMGISSNTLVEPQPITGASGSFAFALGTFTVVPIDVSTYTQVLRFDLDLYWPPYTF